jgi:hypothetical protein
MHTLALHRRPRFVARAFGRNPLLRWTDRVEACAILLATLLAIGLAPVCIAEGAGVARSHARLYAARSQACHTVTASVVETGLQPHLSRTTTQSVLAMWIVGDDGARGGERLVGHTAWVKGDHALKAADHLEIWVDGAGAPVDPPTPSFQAGLDGFVFGFGFWGLATVALMAGVVFVRSPLNRIRRVQLEREIKGFASGGSNRPH